MLLENCYHTSKRKRNSGKSRVETVEKTILIAPPPRAPICTGGQKKNPLVLVSGPLSCWLFFVHFFYPSPGIAGIGASDMDAA